MSEAQHPVRAPEMHPLVFNRLSPEEQIRRARAFYEQMRCRRTVREFSADPVPFEIVEMAIRAAATAPSGANQQPWRFVVVSNLETKRKIRAAAEAEEKEFYEHRAPKEWLEALAPLGTDWRKPFLETAPYLIVIFRLDYDLRHDEQGEDRGHERPPAAGGHGRRVVAAVGVVRWTGLAALATAGAAGSTLSPLALPAAGGAAVLAGTSPRQAPAWGGRRRAWWRRPVGRWGGPTRRPRGLIAAPGEAALARRRSRAGRRPPAARSYRRA